MNWVAVFNVIGSFALAGLGGTLLACAFAERVNVYRRNWILVFFFIAAIAFSLAAGLGIRS